ncbi:mitochondrial carrier domain-containing protein [Protomyces lactucae-debilis]|uniref:Mitochondrial carrier domain-containing protein n=1 Tax=Protomyces lactucae-debilis TaxID=2754530 RepID=A0A1Y2FVF0_PROLT|nr:mitochondrial carrier domain-containing protein [Protomyces lactucae-debilis]ORY87968.1 mitochondrial carrier domain-containing protein [Protomyces lactucae-debilis]
MADAPSSWSSLMGGAFAAMAVDSLIFPLDTIKTRTQAQGGLKANGGYTGLYRGIGSVVACTVPSAALFFWSYEQCKAGLLNLGSHGPANHLTASTLAEALSCAVLAPAEIVKQRAQVASGQHAGGGGQHANQTSREILKELIQGRDMKGLWQGYLGLLLRNVPVTAIQFTLYEAAKKAYKHRQGKKKLMAWESGLCAGASGSIAAAVTTPLDVIKTKVMLNQKGDEQITMWKVAKDTVRQEGAKALFKGLYLRIIWTSMGLSLYLGSYEAMKNYLDEPSEKESE